MLSKILISALLVLQTGFAAADDTSGRKVLGGIDARGLLVRQTSTCPAGSFMCDDGTGCCDVGTTCGFRLSDNYPICKGGSCNGGPVCLSGLCCDLGFECNESSKLCQKAGSVDSSDPPIFSSTPTKSSTTRSTRTPSTKSSTPIPSSTPSVDDEPEDPTTSIDEFESTTRSSPTTRPTRSPTSVLDFGPVTPTNTGASTVPPLGSGADAHSANSVMKVVVGAMAGVLALVL